MGTSKAYNDYKAKKEQMDAIEPKQCLKVE